ncbi:MAG: hypothetical protein CMH63_03325 [Nanoarchaeota archaeon]|jgi:hypothetical protein|nr:hypothetical protein [Nanoarchaeota archaeon]|tara:strand:- start:20369 stop:21949 length:1581 start_codon:yes stop_codon:yes gene_type:complete
MVKCPKCGREVSNQSALKAHMTTHMSRKEKVTAQGDQYVKEGRAQAKRDARAWDIKQGRKTRRGKSGGSVKSSGGGGKWGFLTNMGKEVVTERLKHGGSKGSGSAVAAGNGVSSSGFNWITILLLLVVGFFIYGTVVAPGLDSGFWQSSFGEPIKATLEGTRSVFGYIGNQLSFISQLVSGKELFMWESGGAKIKEKTGISFGELKVWPLKGYVGQDFGVDGIFVVGRLGEKVKSIKLNPECNVEDKVKGVITFLDEEVDPEVGVEIFNQGERYVETPYDFHCRFDGKDSTIKDVIFAKAINTKKINLILGYTIPLDSSLEIFAVDGDTYNEYRTGDAFKETDGGIWADKGYKPKILSKMQYVSEVESNLWFDRQPLGVGKEPILRFRFKNKNTKNKVKLNGFNITLPTGLSFGDCEPLESGGTSREGKLRNGLFKEIERSLNDKEGSGESEPFHCKLSVDNSILGGSTGASIVPAGEIEARLDHTYKLVAEKSITLRQPSENPETSKLIKEGDNQEKTEEPVEGA